MAAESGLSSPIRCPFGRDHEIPSWLTTAISPRELTITPPALWLLGKSSAHISASGPGVDDTSCQRQPWRPARIDIEYPIPFAGFRTYKRHESAVPPARMRRQ